MGLIKLLTAVEPAMLVDTMDLEAGEGMVEEEEGMVGEGEEEADIEDYKDMGWVAVTEYSMRMKLHIRGFVELGS